MTAITVIAILSVLDKNSTSLILKIVVFLFSGEEKNNF
jgi:hypothetical protein